MINQPLDELGFAKEKFEKQKAEFEGPEIPYEELIKQKYQNMGFQYVFVIQPENMRTVKEEKTDRDKFVKYIEKTSPFQFWSDVSKAVEPPVKELQTIEDVMRNYLVPPGVINCIIHYVLQTTDMKFTKGFFETIVSHFARLNIKTVPEAMDRLRAEKEANRKRADHRPPQPPLTKGQETLIERLMKRVEHLEARVEELEKQLKKEN
ncbi:hypothetical protein COJ96_10640 [Bacillus sp. AFS073361]|uniref:DnaD domain protein n=1 Tax=Bacillus sp. AFS073361 TaxID=2033511 RepID=UPI000BF39F25|nr:DnaD domain protein [Bacillus sp. AFS073361]PFP29353.1 hypothetical protein COJ96_10640 [Bacillus sp. AFS073361]